MNRTRTSLAVVLGSTTALIGLLGAGSPAGAEPVTAAASSTSSASASSAAESSTVPAPGSSTTGPAPAAGPSSTSASRRAGTPGPACTTDADALTPVVCLPEGFGEDRPGQVVLGGTIEFDAQVVNNGPAVAGAKLVVTLPPQLRLSDDEPVVRYDEWYDEDSDEDGTDLSCTATPDGAVVTCATGPLAANVNALVDIELQPTSAARAGTSASFTTELQPGTEGAFPSTSVEATVTFLLPSRLSLTVTPGKADVVLGRSKDLTVAVRNVGTGPAPDTFAVSLLLPDSLVTGDDGDDSGDDSGDDGGVDDTPHFSITNAPEIELPGDGDLPAPAVAGARSTTVFTAHSRSAARAEATRFALWPVGTVAPGATATFTVTVKALTVGTDDLLVAAFSDTDAGPVCDDSDTGDDTGDDTGCSGFATAVLSAVAAPAAPSSSSGPSVDSNAVADTGVHDLTPQLLLALLALLAGAGLTVAGRTTYRGWHGGH